MSEDDSQESYLHLLTDVHAHPTDDPRLSGPDGIPTLARRLAEEVKIGRICGMSSNTADQVFIRELKIEFERFKACNEDERVTLDFRPCFGYHPWYSHTISQHHPAPSAAEHYRSLFSDCGETSLKELEMILPHLPPPRSLQDVLAEVRDNLERFPDALLGEVGLDRAFRVPMSKSAIKYQPSEQHLLQSEPQDNSRTSEQSGTPGQGGNSHTLALRGKSLSSLTIPIDHQYSILLAQISLAISLGRNISMHSVKSSDSTLHLLEDCCRRFNGLHCKSFRSISLDLHSCTLSSEVASRIIQLHPNVYISFSSTINKEGSQKSLPALLLEIPPSRILIESDWHTSDQITSRNLEVLKLVTPFVLRERFNPDVKDQQGMLKKAAEVLNTNWRRFERNQAVRQEDCQDDDEREEEEMDKVYQFEEQWFKDVKQWKRQKNKQTKAK
ncbi:unnamed protein product [Sympodiomycopsis kandeliae]